jgi:hypothetical protein
VRYDGYNGTANVYTAADAAFATRIATQNTESPQVPMHFAPVDTAIDSKYPAYNHKCTLTATFGNDFSGNKHWYWRHRAKRAQHDFAIEIDNEESKWLQKG